jgi:DinB family protein
MLRENLEKFRATRARTLKMADGLTQTQLDYAPAPERWSIGEVLDHMLLAERLNRGQIAKLIELSRNGRKPELELTFADLNISVAGIPRSVLSLMETPMTVMNRLVPDGLRNYLTRHRLIPFRNPDLATPRRGRAGPELRADLMTSLQETELLLQRNVNVDFSKLILSHPLLGAYDVPGLLTFMSAHEERHQSQISDIRRDPGFSLINRKGRSDGLDDGG